ncbi:MAG TPA: hypothetical protein PLF22_12320 [Pseudomonadales bacterium]|nr:hypothetical protein [Pseudomonadales bacterium]
MPGVIGMTICPGKKGPSIYGKPWDRDLDSDMKWIRYEWHADVMVTLLEPHEFSMLGVEALQDLAATTLEPQWMHLEIIDGDIPDTRFEQQWPWVRAQLIGVLSAGGKVLVHCRGGLGRTGLVVARLLVETGLPADETIALVRSVRVGAIETAAQEHYVRNIAPSLPVSLRHGLTLPLSELLTAECADQDKLHTSELALTVFAMVMARWSVRSPEFTIKRAGAALLGIPETAFAALISGENPKIADAVLRRIDWLSRIALSLSTLFEGDPHREVEWLEVPRNGNDALIEVMGYTTPLEYLKTNGDAAFVFISDYLRQRAETLRSNDRYLLCMGVQHTLLNTTDMAAITALLRSEQGIENLTENANRAFENIKRLPITVMDDKNRLIIKRPYLDEFLNFVESQPNLDVAIISWAERSYIVNCLEKAAPVLLERCKFIWTGEDQSKYWKRLCNGDLCKGLHNIPELHGYKRGKILMLQYVLGLFKNGIFPEESQVMIRGFRMHTLNPESMMEDGKLLDAIETIRHLIQQDDIVAHIREAECIQGDDPCFKPLTKELLVRIGEAVANFDVDLLSPLAEDDE